MTVFIERTYEKAMKMHDEPADRQLGVPVWIGNIKPKSINVYTKEDYPMQYK